MEIIICMIANLFRMYIIYRFVKTFFDEKKDIKLLVPVYGIYYVINTALYLEFHLAWLNVINTFAGIIVIVGLYAKSAKKTLEVASLIYILNMACDIVSTLSFRDYTDGTATSGQMLFILCDFLYLICELIVEKLMKVHDAGQKLPLVIVPMVSVCILVYMLYSRQMADMAVVVASAGMLVINFGVIYLYNVLLVSLEKEAENRILVQKINMYNNQIEIISQTEERLSSIKHDMRNHLNEIKILAENGKFQEIKRYIDDMDEYMGNPADEVATGNIGMDSLLNYLLKKSKEQLNDVDVKVDIPEKVSDSFDINVVIGNLFDNAIEAAAASDDKELSGFIMMKHGVLKIQLSNSYDKNKEKSSARRHHGIGLRNVQQIAEKYNGVMEISQGKEYCIRLLMYIPDKNTAVETGMSTSE